MTGSFQESESAPRSSKAYGAALANAMGTGSGATCRIPFTAIGKSQPLRSDLSGWWSRRITGKHRLVNCVKDGALEVAKCRCHYQLGRRN